jgi:hypothetical protein
MGIAYGHEKQTVVRRNQKLLVSAGDGYERGFVLGPDRREAGVLDDPDAVDALRGLLPDAPAVVGRQLEATEEIEEHLRELGYIE